MQAATAPAPAPQALGPKAPGKIRIGIAPAQAQLGQGNSGQADYGTPIRNAIVSTMSGPAVEIAPLDAHIPIQLQAEAQEKQCDYILLSSVTVKHSSSSFDKYMKMGSAAANFNPMIAMTRSMGTMAAQASQVATQAAVMTAQQQVASQLASFNGQIKTKDDVTVDYQLYPTGQGQPKLQSSLKGKAKADGEDVLTPAHRAGGDERTYGSDEEIKACFGIGDRPEELMRATALVAILLLGCGLSAAENLEKSQKKELESQAKAIIAEAKSMEKSGQLAEARTKYVESQAMIEMKDAESAIKRLDEEIHKRIKDALSQSHKLYEAHKYKEAALALEEGTKLGSFEGVLSSNLALCYYQLGDRDKSVENLDKAITDTPDPKKKQKLQELMTFLTTGENGNAAAEDETKQIAQFNRLAELAGFDASLEDEEGAEEEASFSESGLPPVQLVAEKSFTSAAPAPHASHAVVARKSSMCTALEGLKGNAAASAAAVYDRANCAEINGRPTEAIRLLGKYLEIAPQALDADEVRARIAELQSLATLHGQKEVKSGGTMRRPTDFLQNENMIAR